MMHRVLATSALAGTLWLAPAWAEEPPAPTPTDSVGVEVDDAELPADLQPAVEAMRAEIQDDVRAQLEAERAELHALRDEIRNEVRELRKLVVIRDAEEHAKAVADDVISLGQRIEIREDQRVGNVVANGQDVVVRGHVTGDISAVWGDIVVTQTGVVDGDAVTVGGEVIVEDGAVMRGNHVSIPLGEGLSTVAATDTTSWLSTLYHRLVFLLAFAGAGVLLVGLFPERIGRIADTIAHRPVRAGLAGTAWGLGLGAAALAFLITLVGIPITLVILAVIGLAWMLGFVGLCQALGDQLPFAYKPHGRWLAFLIGSLAVSFAGALPWIGWLVVLAASALGIGAAFSTRFGGRSLA